MFEVFAHDEKTAALQRQATAFADAGDLKSAIVCLRKATKRMKTSPVAYPVESWLRLPLYLQKAGQFKKAMVEFQRIIEETDWRINKSRAPEADTDSRQCGKHADLQTIYDKMRLACKREGLPEEAAKYEVLSLFHREEFKRLFKPI